MLTQLATVKTRLGIAPADTTPDALLTAFIQAVSARFDRECNRTFARTVDATEEFEANQTEILPACYPIETVTRFEFKSEEAEGWAEVTPAYLIRRACVVSLSTPLGLSSSIGRVTYTGGYVLPGSVPGEGQGALPKDLEHAATEQVAAWYQNRDKVGLIRHWPNGGLYVVLSQAPLVSAAVAAIRCYRRVTI